MNYFSQITYYLSLLRFLFYESFSLSNVGWPQTLSILALASQVLGITDMDQYAQLSLFLSLVFLFTHVYVNLCCI